MKEEKQMEIFFAIAAVAVVAAIIVLIVIKKSKKKKPEIKEAEKIRTDIIVPEEKEADTSPVTFSEDVSVSFNGVSLDYAERVEEFELRSAMATAEKAQAESITEKKAPAPPPPKPKFDTEKYLSEKTRLSDEPAEANPEIIKLISSLFSGKYYFDGYMVNSGGKTVMEIAMNGSDYHVFSEMDKKDMGIMMLGSKTYLINPDTKKYAELTASFRNMIGLDSSKLTIDIGNVGLDADSPEKITKAVYDGENAVCYTYKNERLSMSFIEVSGEIKQFFKADPDGSDLNVLEADEFSSEIPEEMLNFKGYSKTNIITFVSSLM